MIISNWYNITFTGFILPGLLLLISLTLIFFLGRNLHQINRERVSKPKKVSPLPLTEYDIRRMKELENELKEHYSEEYYIANRIGNSR